MIKRNLKIESKIVYKAGQPLWMRSWTASSDDTVKFGWNNTRNEVQRAVFSTDSIISGRVLVTLSEL